MTLHPDNRRYFGEQAEAATAAYVALAREHGLDPMGEVFAIDAGPNAGRRVAYFRDDNGLTLEFLETR